MQPELKKILRALSLDIRHTLEGTYDNTGLYYPGDLETRLNELGVWRDRPAKPLEEMPHLSPEDKAARQVIDAYIAYRAEAVVSRAEAVAEFVRESAYNWANRLLALRCMEARGIIDEIILQKEIYGGRSLVHNRLAHKNPETCAGPDEGLFAVLLAEFEERSKELPELFAPTSPAIALRPSLPALKRCLALLSGTQKANGQEAATDAVFSAPDALGWAYQYWNTEEKARVFEKVHSQKGAKIEGADIIPATQLYTEPYMVQFLVQNSLGATWMGMHPESKLAEGWEYYVKNADRTPTEPKPIEEITLLDPACGSGHFLLDAFDLFFKMHRDEDEAKNVAEAAASILNHNLYGIDIDERAVQIAAAALWMKAKEYASDLQPEALTSFHQHLIATNIRLPKGKDHLKTFLARHPEAAPLQPALEAIFEGLENVHELGSLVQIGEPVEKELHYQREKYESAQKRGVQGNLFEQIVVQGELPLGVESYDQWQANTLIQLERHFNEEAQTTNFFQALFGRNACKGLELFNLLAQRFDIVVANPPYMGSHKMGRILLNYLKNNYDGYSRDIYAAFFKRISQLITHGGYASLVTMHGWLFLSSMSKLRGYLTNSISIQIISHLGTNAFQELGDHAPAAMTCIQNTVPGNDHSIIFYDLTFEKDKAKILDNSIKTFRRYQRSFAKMPGNRIFYSLPSIVTQLFEDLPPLEKYYGNDLVVRRGLDTGNVPRFVRCHWEVPIGEQEWVSYCKGGDTRRWYGNSFFNVRWKNVNNRLDFSNNAIIPNRNLYFKNGVTFSRSSGTGLNARYLSNDTLMGCEGPGILGREDLNFWNLLGFLGSRAVEYIASIINPSMHYQTGDVAVIPLPKGIFKDSNLDKLSRICFDTAKTRAAFIPIDRIFNPQNYLLAEKSTLSQTYKWMLNQEIILASLQHTIEGLIDKECFNLYGINIEQASALLSIIGLPSAWYSSLYNYDRFPQLDIFSFSLPSDIMSSICVEIVKNQKFEGTELAKERLRTYFEAGWSTINSRIEIEEKNLEANDEDFEEYYLESKGSVPPETLIEDFARRLLIHPLTVYYLLKEGIEREGWRCPPEEKRITENIFTVLVLRLLGHRWPKQIEVGEPVPDWADPDGIIPLTTGLAESTLLERVRTRLPEEFSGGNTSALEREFEEIMGESLDKWLSSSFFKHHISQFKKRPIAWQLTSRPANGVSGKRKSKSISKTPAFSCLIYYHKLDHNTLTTLQSQYIRPLRQSCETELRTLEGLVLLTPEQSSRRIQLEAWIDELKEFEARLKQCAQESFANPALAQVAVQEPLDRWTSRDGQTAHPATRIEFEAQEMRYDPDINDGVRVNIAPLQKFGLLAQDVLDAKDLEKAISDRAEWRADERRWCREGKLPKPGWWK